MDASGSGEGGEEEVPKVDANAVIGVPGMLTWASVAPGVSTSTGSSFVRMADRFFRRDAMSSGTGPSAVVVVSIDADS